MSTGWRKRGGGMNKQSDSVEQSVSVGEPVATIDSLEQEIYENTREFVSLNVMGWLLNRLNTHQQPKREPLTDEQIDEVIKQHTGGFIGGMHFIHLARAIEAAHGIRPSDFKE